MVNRILGCVGDLPRWYVRRFACWCDLKLPVRVRVFCETQCGKFIGGSEYERGIGARLTPGDCLHRHRLV